MKQEGWDTGQKKRRGKKKTSKRMQNTAREKTNQQPNYTEATKCRRPEKESGVHKKQVDERREREAGKRRKEKHK